VDLNPLNQIDPLIIVATIAIIGVTFVLLKRYFVEPYLDVMERREDSLRDAEQRRDEARQLLAAAQEDAESSLAEARVKAEQAVSQARDRVAAYRKERIATASGHAATQLEEGRAHIESERAVELERLRERAIECVGLACKNLLGAADSEAVEQAVDRLMARRLA
jgi:F0F1-type ATP synthase membrane subunit b/b'